MKLLALQHCCTIRYLYTITSTKLPHLLFDVMMMEFIISHNFFLAKVVQVVLPFDILVIGECVPWEIQHSPFLVFFFLLIWRPQLLPIDEMTATLIKKLKYVMKLWIMCCCFRRRLKVLPKTSMLIHCREGVGCAEYYDIIYIFFYLQRWCCGVLLMYHVK